MVPRCLRATPRLKCARFGRTALVGAPRPVLEGPTRSQSTEEVTRAESSKTSPSLAGAALVLAVVAASPAGGAARRSIAAFAINAGAVNGIKASRAPKPGRLVPLGRNAKLPASVVPDRGPLAGRPAQRGLRGHRARPGAGPVHGPAGPAGPGAAKLAYDVPANTPVATILTFGGLILRAACSTAETRRSAPGRRSTTRGCTS